MFSILWAYIYFYTLCAIPPSDQRKLSRYGLNYSVYSHDYFTVDPESLHQNDAYPSVVICPIKCFLLPPLYEMIECFNRNNFTHREFGQDPRPVVCRVFIDKGEVMIGRKESIRGFQPGTLKGLLELKEELLVRTGQLLVHLNLNMVRLGTGTFEGLESVITEIRLLNVVQMHLNSLLPLRFLRSFEIESRMAPITVKNKGADKTEIEEVLNVQSYFRLRPVDVSSPITFNIETKCHQCVKPNKTEETTIIITFPESRMKKSNSKPETNKLSLIFPQSCPVSEIRIGCLGYKEEISLLSPTSVQSGDKTLLLLCIWCTLLTIILVVICLLGWRFRHKKSFPKWFPAFCQPESPYESDIEEQSDLTKNGDHKRPHGENETLLNDIMTESRSSWNSNAFYSRKSPSITSLEDKWHRHRSVSRSVCRRNKIVEPKLRSIGSQTDFTDIDSEMLFYSSLRHSGFMNSDFQIPEPPTRTSSQYALARLRYSYRMDGIYPRAERTNRGSMNGFIDYNPNQPASLYVKPVDSDSLFRPNNKLRDLPPVYPITRTNNINILQNKHNQQLCSTASSRTLINNELP